MAGLVGYLVSASLLDEELETHRSLQKEELEAIRVFQTVQTRITACVALAEHHFEYRDPKEIGEPLVLESGELATSSTNQQRHSSSINMTRALSLCLEDSKDASSLSSCISLRTLDDDGLPDDYVAVFDTISSKINKNLERQPGKMNPAC